MYNADFSETEVEADAFKATARTLDLEVVLLEIQRAEDVAPPLRRSNLRLKRLENSSSTQEREFPVSSRPSAR